MLRIQGTSKRLPKSLHCPQSALGILIGYCVRISPVIEVKSPAVSGRITILLASNSPRRRELMALGNRPFDVLVTDVDESQRPGESPADYVLRLAEAKAHAAVPRAQPYIAIVAADTTVVDGSAILGKPRDAAEAVQMLKQLRGHVHQVYTGLAVLRMDTGQLLKDLCVTDVPMRDYSDAEIDRYVPPAIRSIKLAPMPYNMPSSIQWSD